MHRIMIARLALRAKASLSIARRDETILALVILRYAEIAVRRRGACILFYSR